jgi:hypothetical protein
MDSKIKRQIQTDSSGNEVNAKDCKMYMEGSQNQWRNIKKLKVTSIDLEYQIYWQNMYHEA